ncbi:MAG: hypothetical protein ACTH30_03625 [Leucobacter sp.]
MTTIPPGPVAGLVTALAKKLTQRMRDEAGLHANRSFNLVYSLGDTLSDFAPLVVKTALDAGSKLLSKADVAAYKELEDVLERAVKSLPEPKWGRSVVFFWKDSDCREPIQRVLLSMATVVPLISETVSTLDLYRILKERRTSSDPGSQVRYEEATRKAQKVVKELEQSLVGLDENVDFAAAFLLAWRSGSGSVSKKKVAALREASAKRREGILGWV